MPRFTNYRDPLHVLLEYIAERTPNCDLVLVHDDDLDRLRRVGNGTSLETLQPDAVVRCLQRSEPEIRVAQVACDSLHSSRGSMVAAFSEELNSWDEPFCPSRWQDYVFPLDATTPSSPVMVSSSSRSAAQTCSPVPVATQAVNPQPQPRGQFQLQSQPFQLQPQLPADERKRLAREYRSPKRDGKRDDLGRLSNVPTTTSSISSKMRGLSPISDSGASNQTRASGSPSVYDLEEPLFDPAVNPPSQACNSPAMLLMNRICSDPAKDFVNPSPPLDADALLRRFSTPSSYTAFNSAKPSSQEGAIIPYSNIPFDTLHKYILTSRRRDYATVVVMSRAPSVLAPPLLHLGDELNGRIVLRSDKLSDMRSMEVAFRLFESDPVNPSYETKRTLLSQEVDESCISDGLFTWPFVIKPPPVLSSTSSSTTASGRADSSLTYLSPRRHLNSPIVQLIVKIYRRGRLTPNVRFVLSTPHFQ
ncbi:hypothetical protein BJY52DRAFT_536751 [Lactarius psammicola]|nr:hypothetical protein BJY52DRAFT_536751 [Lactarius psammicola]